ncbi:Sphingoid long-chain base transporter [Lachnellula hyalina]|uniref:Sphingoid long-chain base transporter n=1 Tax=Lachnellula hyalina TaxID=1316788 RepID=A0A8H8R7X8_9HELO|nr:Sphingoid long-chain base transporter [Lachnellula hyalina]TVY30195.1 Sphingoid long-chain base transporter [Lachnellula hyalina]
MVIGTPSCQAYSPEIHNPFGYRPSLAAGIVFLILFFLSACTHLFQAIRYRKWWLSLFVLGAGCECLGWIARTAAWKCSYSSDLFSMQIAILIFSPAFTTAGIYIILFRMIPILGKHSSPFPPKLCLLLCLGIDIVSLSLQAAGGGLAAQSFHKATDTRPGTYTMVAGILFQLASTISYSILMSIVFVRGFAGIKDNKPLRWLSGAMVLAIVCMITRGVYRSIELLQGWRGFLNTHQVYIIALDGALMVIAVVALNVCNPERLLKQAREEIELANPLVKEPSSKETKVRTIESSDIV